MNFATIIRPELSALVYLIAASVCCGVTLLLCGRPILSGVIGAALAMLITSLARFHLPFDYWAHANDFIIEPFAQGKMLRQPLEGALSFLFHVGLPVVVTVLTGRILRTRQPAWRFSLRTLLIATTLIAMVLGIIVWMSRAG